MDYQTGKVYRGAEWQRVTAGPIPVVLLVKDHTVIPHIRVAQSTSALNWTEIELQVFSSDRSAASGLFALPQGDLQRLSLSSTQEGFVLKDAPLGGKVKWQVRLLNTQ
jgi:alpha-D-xyloside xylohydrolase